MSYPVASPSSHTNIGLSCQAMGGSACSCCRFSLATVPSSRVTVKNLSPFFPGSNTAHYCNGLRFIPLTMRSIPVAKLKPRRERFKVLDSMSTQPTTSDSQEVADASDHNPSSSQAMPLVDSEISGAESRLSEAGKKIFERRLSRKAEQSTYLFAAIASSVLITFLAAGSVYYRFAWQMQGGEVPQTEMFGTFALALGAAVGMEYWARWAHRALWHASLWDMHESHHRPRDGPFELNDVFAIINAVPAISLMAYGFFHKGLVPGLCFGAGLGITVFGMAYMFVHDGLVHRRFPVGPIANVPYLQKVAAAHQLHHADKFSGVPYGLFLGPKELEEVGGLGELEKLLQKRKNDVSGKTQATDG